MYNIAYQFLRLRNTKGTNEAVNYLVYKTSGNYTMYNKVVHFLKYNHQIKFI
jgi:hypothetical protein